MSKIPPGTPVEVVGNRTHLNKHGKVVGNTEKRVKIRFEADEDHDSAYEVRFHPKNVMKLSTTESPSLTSDSSFDTCIDEEVLASSGPTDRDPFVSSAQDGANQDSNPYQTRVRVNPSQSPFMMGDHRIGSVKLLLKDQDNPLSHTLAGCLFPDRLCKTEYNVSARASALQTLQAQKVIIKDGYRLELLAQKVQTDDKNAKFGRLARPELFYVRTQGPGLEEIDLQEFLSTVADFESLDPSKAASRMELLLTPSAKKGKKNHLLVGGSDGFESITRGCEQIEEECHEGCGFCPKSLIKQLFGDCAVGRRTNTIQVRMIAPEIGLIKGLLTVKEGIEKVQIPPSMVKAGPSKHHNPYNRCILLVKRKFPSEKNRYLAQYFSGKELSDTGLNSLQIPMSDMIKDVLIDSGVPKNLICEYEEKKIGRRKERDAEQKSKPRKSNRAKYKATKKRGGEGEEPKEEVYFADASCVGAADPTPSGNIPPGFVAIPGLPRHVDSVLVSRSPCMHKADLLRLRVLKMKPRQMSRADWDSLNSRHFGDVYFGNGLVPLPNLIAAGDNDGDLYFVLWDKDIVESVQLANIVDLEQHFDLPKKHAKKHTKKKEHQPAPCNSKWFVQMQDVVADVGLTVRTSKLIGALHNEAKIELESNKMSYNDYVALSNAYKSSLDLRKHGDKVELPEHLWDAVPQELHEFLTPPKQV